MAALTENNLLDAVYSLYETDNDNWGITSAEYLTARVYANDAIGLWEKYRNTTWRELWTELSSAADGDKTTTASDWDYDCPTNFVRPSSWVRTINNNSSTYWQVIDSKDLARYDNSGDYFCWFTGSQKDGFDLHFNHEKTLNTGDTIAYEYYKSATLFTATTSTTEMADPYFIVYYVLARLLKNDGEDYREEKEMWMERLENMRTANGDGLSDVPNPILDSITSDYGFGE